MMAQYSWFDCPPAVREQGEQLIHDIVSCLQEQLIGIYLHGSLAMGCFNPERSDLDILVITGQALPLQRKRRLIEGLLRLSRQPQPIEISFVQQSDLVPWRYPAPFDLHYSEMWRESYERNLAGEGWLSWNDTQRRDPDLAAHVTVINARGLCLYGPPIADLFPPVPAEDYLASVAGDIYDGLDRIRIDPVYSVLNCCRTYAYLREGHIYSKAEGGDWALAVLPAQFHPVITTALKLYRKTAAEQPFDPDALDAFAIYMRQSFAPILPPPNSAATEEGPS
jgi:streptomycin 3"-adenylyltransferase